jgi:hypothetical protein
MENVRHTSPTLAIFTPNQFRTIAESRFVLQARLSVVPIVFPKNIPALAQLGHSTRHAPIYRNAVSRTILPYIPQACPIPS